MRELFVGHFQFLQAQHIGLTEFEPIDDMLLAHLEGIHVPRGEFHVFPHPC